MRSKWFAFILISALLTSCEKEPTKPNFSSDVYNQMLFMREGGGNLTFTIAPIVDSDSFQVSVSSIAYHDTNFQKIIYRNAVTSGLLDTLILALKGQIPLEGSFRQTAVPTGTWAYVYMLNGNKKTEVTNESLRTALLKLEFIVLSAIGLELLTDWLMDMIKKFESDPVGNPPQSIWQYQFKGQTVFYIPPQCCDQFSVLYDLWGNILCVPDGGFSGRGDGRCTDFFQERKNGILIWQDSRKR